jgi:hypothetical protein
VSQAAAIEEAPLAARPWTAAAGQRQERTPSKARRRRSRRPCRQTLCGTPLLGQASDGRQSQGRRLWGRPDAQRGAEAQQHTSEGGRRRGHCHGHGEVGRKLGERPRAQQTQPIQARGMAGKRTTREGRICTQSSERKTGEGDQAGGAGRTTLVAMVAGALGVSVRCFRLCLLN